MQYIQRQINEMQQQLAEKLDNLDNNFNAKIQELEAKEPTVIQPEPVAPVEIPKPEVSGDMFTSLQREITKRLGDLDQIININESEFTDKITNLEQKIDTNQANIQQEKNKPV